MSFDIPILFIVFNRPKTTIKVFDAIRTAKPKKLYIAIDAPRIDKLGEKELVQKVVDIVTKVDWVCDLKILRRKENLGCKYGPKNAIDWFFDNESLGVILEDDCLPDPDFFIFCKALLERYQDEEQVWTISGNNFQDGKVRGKGSYYFSKYNHVWGWATWRRAWQKNDSSIAFWGEWSKSLTWIDSNKDPVERKYWFDIFERVYCGETETAWDYPWTASMWFHGGVTVAPNVNLVSNIGFGKDATHTLSESSKFANMDTHSIGSIRYLDSIVLDEVADTYTFNNAFYGSRLRYPWVLILPFRRWGGHIYRTLKNRYFHKINVGI